MKIVRPTDTATVETSYFNPPFPHFQGDVHWGLAEELVSRDFTIEHLKGDDETRTVERPNSAIVSTSLNAGIIPFEDLMELQYAYYLCGGNHAEFAVTGTFSGRTPSMLNRWAFTGDMSISLSVDSSQLQGSNPGFFSQFSPDFDQAEADENGVSTTPGDYKDFTAGSLVEPSEYRHFSGVVQASITQRSPIPTLVDEGESLALNRLPTHECFGQYGESARYEDGVLYYPNGGTETTPEAFPSIGVINHRKKSLFFSNTQVYDLHDNKIYNLAGVTQGFIDSFGWVVLHEGNLKRLDGTIVQDLNGTGVALQRFDNEVFLANFTGLMRWESSQGMLVHKKIETPWDYPVVSLFLSAARLGVISWDGVSIRVSGSDQSIYASTPVPTTINTTEDPVFIHGGYSSSGYVFTLKFGEDYVWGRLNRRQNPTDQDPSRVDESPWSLELFEGTAEVIAQEIFTLTDLYVPLSVGGSINTPRYTVDMRVYLKRADSPPFTPLPMYWDADSQGFPNSNSSTFLIKFAGEVWVGSSPASSGILHRQVRSIIQRGDNRYAVVVYVSQLPDTMLFTRLVRLERLGTTTDQDGSVVNVVPDGMLDTTLTPIDNSTLKTILYQDKQRSTYEFPRDFYFMSPEAATTTGFNMRNFDTAAWTNWDLPVNFFLREIQPSNDNLELGNGSNRIICNIYACPGLQPEGIELKLGLEGDNTAFSVPAHGMFDDCLEVNLGLDPSVFIISNPVRVAQDVHCWMMLDFGEISEIVEEENPTIPVNFRVISSNETLGGDRPEFTFPNNLATQGTIQGISSFSRLSEDYNTAWRVGSDIIIEGRNPSQLTPTLLDLVYRHNTFFSSNRSSFPASVTAPTPNTNNGTAIVSGTSVGVVSPTVTATFYQLGTEQIGDAFPVSYSTPQNIDRTFDYQPGSNLNFSFNSAFPPGSFSVNTHTFREVDEYTSGTGSSGAGSPSSCTEEEASEGILWMGPDGIAPGRNKSTHSEWNVEASSTIPFGFVAEGSEVVRNSQRTYSATQVQDQSVSVAPRSWSVNAVCVGTGTISFVPRVRLNVSVNGPVITASSALTRSVSGSHTGIITVLPGYDIPVEDSFEENTFFSTPAYNPQTQPRVTTSTFNASSSTHTVDLGFYDEEATSCLFRETETSRITEFLRVDTSPPDYNNFFADSNSFIPSGLPFPTSFFGSTGTSGGTPQQVTGQQVITDTNSNLVKGIVSGETEFVFGEFAPPVNLFFPSPVNFSTVVVGDTLTAPSFTFTVREILTRTIQIPGSSSTETSTFREITASSQVLGKRFIIQQRLGAELKYTVLVCTAVALGEITGTAFPVGGNPTQEFRSVTLRVDEIHRETFGTPITSSTNVQAFRFDDVSDLFLNSAVSRRRLTIRRSADPNVFWNIWASQPPQSVSGSVPVGTHTYSQGQLLRNGKINWDFTPVSRAYEGHSGSVNFIKVNP
jgi:hypothetical protein